MGFRRRRDVRLLLCLCALGVVGSLVGCGASSAIAINNSYSIVVTATGGSISHTASIDLTVQ